MNRSLVLDVLRIFAIGLVLVAHFGQLLGTSAGGFFGLKNLYYVSLGGVGVSLFLVLSGILAGLGGFPGKVDYLAYMVKKALRIYPLYWLSAPLAMAGYVLGGWGLDGDIPPLFPNGAFTDLIGSFTGFYSWLGLWGGPYNSPSWFIALIMTMYALFPMMFVAMQRQPHVVIAVLFLVSLGSRYYVGQEGVPFAAQTLFGEVEGWLYRQFGFMPGRPGDWFPPCRLFEFGLGVYLALVLPRSTWFSFGVGCSRPICQLSDLAFPLFLIHYPFMFLVPWLEEMGLPLGVSIALYLAGIFLVSSLVNAIDQHVPRKRLMSLLTGRAAAPQGTD